jgi:hypothetical protein
MDLEQLAKRLDWLDQERRKDKLVIQTLEERLAGAERDLPGLLQQVKEISSEVTRLMTVLTRSLTRSTPLWRSSVWIWPVRSKR